MTKELVEVVQALNADQRWLLLELPADRSERTWPHGLPSQRLSGLRYFGRSEFIVSFHDHKGSHIALSSFGAAVRDILEQGKIRHG